MKLNMFRNGWLAVALIAAGIPLAVLGILAAQSLDNYFSLAATSIFASVLLVSLVTNLAIALAWRPWRPPLLVTPSALPLVQTTLLAVEVVWLAAILTNNPLLGIVTSAALASVSIAVFVIVVVPDSLASGRMLERSQRRAAARDARTPAERGRRRIRAAVVAGVLVAAVGVPVAVVQTTTTVHPDCDINGAFYSGGTIIVSSTNCGDFAQPGSEVDYEAMAGRFGDYDIVSRGYWLGHPWIVELRPVEG